MAGKKKTWYSNGNLVILVLTALSAAVAAGTTAAIEGISKQIQNRRKGGTKDSTAEPESNPNEQM